MHLMEFSSNFKRSDDLQLYFPFLSIVRRLVLAGGTQFHAAGIRIYTVSIKIRQIRMESILKQRSGILNACQSAKNE